MSKIEEQIKSIQSLTSELKSVEDEYATVKDFVSQLWKKYFPASEKKKALNARRKQLKAALKSKIEAAPELAALLKTIK